MFFKKIFLNIFFILTLLITSSCINTSNRTELWLVRHGQTDWNVQKQSMAYHPQTPLNKTGVNQAELTGNYLLQEHQQKPFTVIYSSDFLRAHKTAELIGHKIGLPINDDQRLREGDDNQAETKEQATKQIVQILQEIIKKHTGQRIIIVTHGGCLNKISRWIRNNFPQQESSAHDTPENASISLVSITNNNWKIEQWGQIHHLKKSNLALIQ